MLFAGASERHGGVADGHVPVVWVFDERLAFLAYNRDTPGVYLNEYGVI